MIPFLRQILVELIYLIFIMLNNNIGNEPANSNQKQRGLFFFNWNDVSYQ